jgi:predicted phage-related endonuclease
MPDQKLRRNRIGGSEVAAIFGAHEWLTAFGLWDRIKHPKPREGPPDLRMVMGQLLEEGLLDIYSYVTQRPVKYSNQTVVDPDRPYMVATPDGFCVNERRGVDLKLVAPDQARKFGEDNDEIPPRIVLQCDWYMAAFDYDLWDVCAFPWGTPRIYELERDRECERAMLARVEEWHARYILGDEVPPIDSSPEARRWLQEVYPTHRRPDLREADPDEVDRLNQYVSLRVLQRELKAKQVELETAFKAAIKDREGLEWEEGKFTWRRTKDGKKTEWESMARGLLNQFVLTDEERADLLDFYTHPVPGYRKIRIDHPALRKGAQDEEEVTA